MFVGNAYESELSNKIRVRGVRIIIPPVVVPHREGAQVPVKHRMYVYLYTSTVVHVDTLVYTRIYREERESMRSKWLGK